MFSNEQRYKKIGKGLLGIGVLLFVCSKFLLYHHIVVLKIIQLGSIVWGSFILFFLYVIPKVPPIIKRKEQEKLVSDVIILTTVLIASKLVLGIFVYGLGKNPYDTSLLGILSNQLRYTPELIGKEMIRAYLLGVFCNKKNTKVFISVTIMFLVFELDIQNLMMVGTSKELIIYLAEEFLPIVCKNMTLSLLALYGGWKISALYAVIILTFQRTFPVLPALDWFATGSIEIGIPVASMLYLIGKYDKEKKTKKEIAFSERKFIVDILLYGVAVTCIWFIIGVFPIYPSVILTGSMEPEIQPGDVVLLHKIKDEKELKGLKKGDVIQFQRDEIRITHRVEAVVKEDNGGLAYQTKGDNNSATDDRLVKPEEVRGTLYTVVPKIGTLTVWIKGKDDSLQDIEF